ncbi:MAG TPA: nucleoside-diphosphate sugar epimerase/dehydratase [Hyphomicrobium sp.]|nr:nucleoside-diphosphate sugar epimerase/dehydratase [Hyphomicrobium sp.]
MSRSENDDSTAGQIRRWLLGLTRHQKRVVLAASDLAILLGVLWLLTFLRYGYTFLPDSLLGNIVYWSGPFITISAFAYMDLYRFVTRHLGSQAHTRIIGGVLVSVLVWALLVFMTGQSGMPRSVILSYSVFATVAVIGIRYVVARFLQSSGIDLPRVKQGTPSHPVLIYGAGDRGMDLALALRRSPDRDVVGFCDNSPSLWGQYVAGYRVYRPEKLGHIIERHGVREILLTIPAGDRHERRMVLKQLESFPVTVKVLPSLADLASGKVAIADLRPLQVEDLLGRDAVPPNTGLLARDTKGKNVLVTGAGGSVGSELVRQVLRQGPRRLILLDVSEPALYEIETEVRDLAAAMTSDGCKPEFAAILGSVLDASLVRDVLGRYAIDTIYHAAAYKHVPIVERNPAVGLANNVRGTEIVADAALACGVERMVLISTDKAVRPTNVMGASKRLAELVLQTRASQSPATVFTMVRFGNVLGSSGSVVRRFRRQIEAGGPVTVTHPEVVRYFMSIPEAAELVIQAGAMARGGEVFVLDMGEPVKIKDLAELMIRLSGLDVVSESNPDGDIEIVYSGLRPGEKLYEELLIGGLRTSATEHPRILRSDEPALAAQELRRELDLLEDAVNTRDMETVQAVLMRTVEGYQPDPILTKAPPASWVPQGRTLH